MNYRPLHEFYPSFLFAFPRTLNYLTPLARG